jgi:hypothetical protein
MKRNTMEESKFDPDLSIHTPIESLYQVYETHIVLKNVNDDFLSSKISTQKGRFEWPCF